CVPTAVLAKAAKEPADARADLDRPAAEAPPGTGTAAAAAGTAAALTAAPSRAAKTDGKDPTSERRTQTSGAAAPAAAPPGDPVRPEGMVREQRPRRAAEAQPQPPKIVRDVLRALGFK